MFSSPEYTSFGVDGSREDPNTGIWNVSIDISELCEASDDTLVWILANYWNLNLERWIRRSENNGHEEYWLTKLLRTKFNPSKMFSNKFQLINTHCDKKIVATETNSIEIIPMNLNRCDNLIS